MIDADNTTCAVPRCKTDGAVKFRGKWMCDAHWLHVEDIGDKRGFLAEESQLARWGWPGKTQREQTGETK